MESYHEMHHFMDAEYQSYSILLQQFHSITSCHNFMVLKNLYEI